MNLKSRISEKYSKGLSSLFFDLLSWLDILFVLLLSIGLTYLEIFFVLREPFGSLLGNYHIVVPIAIMNFTVMKVIIGYTSGFDPIIAILGTALFVYFGCFHPEHRLVLRSDVETSFMVFNYVMMRVCWAIAIISINISPKQMAYIYFPTSYITIFLLYKQFELEQLYPTSISELIIFPIIIYAAYLLAKAFSLVVRGTQLLHYSDRATRRVERRIRRR